MITENVLIDYIKSSALARYSLTCRVKITKQFLIKSYLVIKFYNVRF